jgi:hypothetical protein
MLVRRRDLILKDIFHPFGVSWNFGFPGLLGQLDVPFLKILRNLTALLLSNLGFQNSEYAVLYQGTAYSEFWNSSSFG